jgi:hypothetical protein
LHVLRTPHEARSALAYVLLNSRRHAAKLGLRIDPLPRVDSASSGRWFDGWSTRMPAADDQPSVSMPRTWLLRVGWRRRGLVGIEEVPGAARG